MQKILTLDETGIPKKWVDLETAVNYYCRDMVAWAVGENEFILRGGYSRLSGQQSTIAANSIIAIKGKGYRVREHHCPVGVSKELLFRRDANMCAYCGGVFPDNKLEMEHIQPKSRGGEKSWMNLVTSCDLCNDRKQDRTPEEAGMPLLYVPFVPNRWEAFILMNRRILADQMEFLLQGVKHGRFAA